MTCSISSVPDIADCIYRLKDIVDLAHAAMGIVSTSLLTGLLWCLKRWSKDTDRLEAVCEIVRIAENVMGVRFVFAPQPIPRTV